MSAPYPCGAGMVDRIVPAAGGAPFCEPSPQTGRRQLPVPAVSVQSCGDNCRSAEACPLCLERPHLRSSVPNTAQSTARCPDVGDKPPCHDEHGLALPTSEQRLRGASQTCATM